LKITDSIYIRCPAAKILFILWGEAGPDLPDKGQLRSNENKLEISNLFFRKLPQKGIMLDFSTIIGFFGERVTMRSGKFHLIVSVVRLCCATSGLRESFARLAPISTQSVPCRSDRPILLALARPRCLG
jgi:hypothetical protein